jgi:glyoxylase-like metal-dependent hydrolase (beta-lactamase superfamily II)
MAEFHVLVAGYLRDDEDRVGSTVSAVLDGGSVVVIDPGLVRHVRAIIDPLVELGPSPEDVTDVVISHHHPDHTLKAALFPNARVHDHHGRRRGSRYHRASRCGRRRDTRLRT